MIKPQTLSVQTSLFVTQEKRKDVKGIYRSRERLDALIADFHSKQKRSTRMFADQSQKRNTKLNSVSEKGIQMSNLSDGKRCDKMSRSQNDR